MSGEDVANRILADVHVLADEVAALVEENERRYADAVGLREQLYTDEKLWEINAALEAENERLQRVAEAARRVDEGRDLVQGIGHLDNYTTFVGLLANLHVALAALVVEGEE